MIFNSVHIIVGLVLKSITLVFLTTSIFQVSMNIISNDIKGAVICQICTSRSGIEMKTLILLAVVAFVLSTALVHLRSNDYIEESDTGLQMKEIGNDFTVEHIGR